MTARQRGWLLPPLAICVCAGILLGRIAGSWLYGAISFLSAGFAFFLLRGRGRFCAVLALGLALGCLRGYFACHPVLPPEDSYMISGIISSGVEARENGQIRTSLTHVTLDGQPLQGDAYWSFYADAVPETLLPGRQVAFQGSLYHPSGASNPDGYDFREELLRRGIIAGVYGAQDLSVFPPESFSLAGWAAALRHRLTQALLASPLGEEAGGYAAAMLLGNRSWVPREDRTAFSRLGIAHILSVSGFHVGVLVGALALLFRLLHLPQGIRLCLYALLLGVYAALCGSSQPVIRASLLLLLSHRGRMLARPRSLLHLLCAVMIGMLLWSPVQLTGLSFQLSFGAVFGLALVTPWLSSLWSARRRGTRRLWSGITATLGAQAGILLPQLYAFQEFPLLSLFMNIPVLFLSSLLIGLYWIALLTLPLPGVSGLVCAAARAVTSGLLSAVRFLGVLPGVTLWTAASSWVTALGVLLGAAGCCGLFRWRRRTRAWMIVSGALLACLSLIPLPHRGAEYLQFSAGDADAALLWDQETALVIDAGYEDGVLSDYLHRHRITPEAVILTHLHSDHVYGLRALLEDHIPVSLVYLPDGAENAEVHPDVLLLLDQLRASGTEIRHLSAGDRLSLPSGEIRVLWPEAGQTRPGQDTNESSLVLRITLKGTSLLQTGDLDGKYEMYAAAPANILKVPHHGSARSSSEAFLSAVHPDLALLSCGRTERHEAFRQRLDPAVPLFSTAAGGMLTICFEEGTYSVETFLSPDL